MYLESIFRKASTGTLAALTVLGTQAAQAQRPASKSNIILIVSDDFGYGDAGAYLGGEARGMPTRTSIAWRKKV